MPQNPTATVPSFTHPTVQLTQQQTDRQRALGLQAQVLANALVENCPQGEELDSALLALRTTIMWANQSIITGYIASGATGSAR
jgi:hypothetical protein